MLKYFLVCVLFVAMLAPCYASVSCSCTCCIGIGCTASSVGNADASSCDLCSNACESTYSSCPSSGQSGTVQSSCSSGGSSTSTANWAGTYSVSAGCDTSTCCCLTGDVSVSQSGLDISITGSVTGNCGGVTSWTPRFTLTSSTTTTASFTYMGNNYSASKNGKLISVDNLTDSRCSGQATCTSGPCSSASFASVSLLAVVSVIAGLLF